MPYPPPGASPARHPAVHGSCGGDPLGCERAGNAVRSASTFDAVIKALEAEGFAVTTDSM